MSRLEALLAEIEALSAAGRRAGDPERALELCRRAFEELDALRRRLHTAAAEALLHRWTGDRADDLERALDHARRAWAERTDVRGGEAARLLRLLGQIHRRRHAGDPRENLRLAADYFGDALEAGGGDLDPGERAELRLAAAEVRMELAALESAEGRDTGEVAEGGDWEPPDLVRRVGPEIASGSPRQEARDDDGTSGGPRSRFPLDATVERPAEEDRTTLAAAAEERRRALAGPAPVVNTGFADPGGAGTLPAGRPLEPGRAYRFWFEIAPTRLAGAIETGAPQPLPDRDLPAEAELDVVLFGYPDGLEIDPAADRARLRLRSGGRATVVRAAGARSSEEGAGETARLSFPVRTPERPGPRRLRCGVFHRGLLLQSREVTAWVGAAPPAGEAALVAVVDFTLSTRLDPAVLAAQPRHALSVMVNDSSSGDGGEPAHGVRLWSDAGEGEPIKVESSLGEGVLGNLIASARGALRRASWGGEQEWRPGVAYLYEDGPSRQRLRDDLVRFAIRGYRLFARAMPDLAGGGAAADALHERLRRPAYVQVVHRESASADPVLLPAAMFYDRVGFDTGADPADYRLCPELERALDEGTDLAGQRCLLGDCPHRGEPEVIVCPSGFWGFRHRLGLPASSGDGADAALDAADLSFDGAPDLTVGVSTDPGLPRRAGHEERVRELLAGGGWHRAASRRDLLDLLAHGRPHVVYLYCHGGVAGDLPYLQVGPPTERGVTPDNLYPVLWRGPRPLVVINGCHTTALSPELAQQFVAAFVGRSQAAGVIGTEITIFESLACAFGEELLRRLFAGEPLGEAVRRARLELLAAGNPLGLVYVPYALPGLRLSRREV